MSQEENIKNILEEVKPVEEKVETKEGEVKPDLNIEKISQSPDKISQKQDEVSEEISSMVGDDSVSSDPIPLTFVEREKKVENFLSAGLEDSYLKMDAKKRAEFKREGEKTAKEINSLLEKARIKTKKIISLIKKWLSIIPGVNKFFLEQETKIRADKIIKLKK